SNGTLLSKSYYQAYEILERIVNNDYQYPTTRVGTGRRFSRAMELGLDPMTGGSWLYDIAHHHLAIEILFLIVGHMYKTNWGIGHSLKDISEAHKVGAAVHATIFIVRDYDPTSRYNDIFDRVLRHSDAIISHLNRVIQSYGSSLFAYGLLFLGAHFLWAFSLMFLFSGRGYWQELIESIISAYNKLKVAPATQPRALSIVQGRAVGEGLKGIMALRFPRFSQGLAQDPTTRRICFGIAVAHDFKSHDDITEERLYQIIFSSHYVQLAIIFLWTFKNLFHVAWQGNFEEWI
ncbi:hypothetical protein Goklo_002739, partial [Gossypium klotzschianum]|nr:hypothetical protein [Gossypium klotzschianum]